VRAEALLHIHKKYGAQPEIRPDESDARKAKVSLRGRRAHSSKTEELTAQFWGCSSAVVISICGPLWPACFCAALSRFLCARLASFILLFSKRFISFLRFCNVVVKVFSCYPRCYHR